MEQKNNKLALSPGFIKEGLGTMTASCDHIVASLTLASFPGVRESEATLTSAMAYIRKVSLQKGYGTDSGPQGSTLNAGV